MTYLFWYFVVGIAVLTTNFLAQKIANKDKPPTLSALIDAVKSKTETPPKQLLDDFIGPVLAALVLLTLWPVVIVMNYVDFPSEKVDWEALADNSTGTDAVMPLSEMDCEREFTVVLADLNEAVSVSEIEQRERVVDPMAAVSYTHLDVYKRQRDGL